MKKIFKSNYKFIIFFFLGCVLSFTLPPYNYYILGFVIFPLILYFLKLNESNNSNYFFFFGLIFSFGYFLTSLYWISFSLNFDPRVNILKPFVIIGVPLVLSLFYGLGFYILRRFFKFKFFFLLNFTIILSLTEYLRSYITGFSWNLFVYSLSNEIQSIQILNIFGTYGLNFLTLLIFCFPYLFFSKSITRSIFCVCIFVLVIGINFLYGHKRINSKLYNNNTDIVIVQPNENLKNIFNFPNEYIKKLIKISSPKNKKQDAIFLWPEGTYSLVETNKLEKLIKGNFKKKQKIIFGANTKDFHGNLYNSLIVLNSSGKILDQYKKIHLVPFGEFIPLENYFENFNLKKVTFGYQSFTKGKDRKIINVNGNLVLPLICYEMIDTGLINLTKKNFDVIFNISEDGWFNRSIGTFQHFSHSIFRSIEEGKHILRSTNQGLSASINPFGVILKVSSPSKQIAFVERYQTLNKKTPFSVLGNIMFFFLILIVFLIQIIAKRYLKYK